MGKLFFKAVATPESVRSILCQVYLSINLGTLIVLNNHASDIRPSNLKKMEEG